MNDRLSRFAAEARHWASRAAPQIARCARAASALLMAAGIASLAAIGIVAVFQLTSPLLGWLTIALLAAAHPWLWRMGKELHRRIKP